MTFQVKIQVLRGSIFKINDADSIHNLAAHFADMLHPTPYPGREDEAVRTLKKLANYPESSAALYGSEPYRIFNNRIPATREYVAEVSTLVVRLFEEFKKEFRPPQTLEDGIYVFTSGFCLEKA